MWKIDNVQTNGTRFVHEGYIGLFKVSNAHQVELHSHYGSGFGTKNPWPAIDAKISFAAGEELKAEEFAERLRIFISEELGL